MRWLAAVVLVVLAGSVASAEDKVLVMRSEGRADKKVRTKVEGAVLKLAKATSEATTAGDITFGDAAAMVGCKPDEEKCKDEVINMLSVDEIVTIDANPKPGGIEVAVRRIGKGGTTRNAATLVTADKADQLDALSSLFGRASPPSPFPPAITTPPTTREPTREPMATPHAPTPPPVTTTPPPITTTPPPATIPPPERVAEPTPPMGAMPTDQQLRDEPPRRNRLPMVGMAAGGALLIVGVVFWASASGIEDEIAQHPKRTKADLREVQDLEARGDAYAMAGNVLTVTGLGLGVVSTYFFIKGRKQSSRTARITPMFIGDGAGLAVTWGGSP